MSSSSTQSNFSLYFLVDLQIKKLIKQLKRPILIFGINCYPKLLFVGSPIRFICGLITQLFRLINDLSFHKEKSTLRWLGFEKKLKKVITESDSQLVTNSTNSKISASKEIINFQQILNCYSPVSKALEENAMIDLSIGKLMFQPRRPILTL